jgi:hypothetical protein
MADSEGIYFHFLETIELVAHYAGNVHSRILSEKGYVTRALQENICLQRSRDTFGTLFSPSMSVIRAHF